MYLNPSEARRGLLLPGPAAAGLADGIGTPDPDPVNLVNSVYDLI